MAQCFIRENWKLMSGTFSEVQRRILASNLLKTSKQKLETSAAMRNIQNAGWAKNPYILIHHVDTTALKIK